MRKNIKSLITEMTPEDIAEIATWEANFSADKSFSPIQKYLEFETKELAEIGAKPSNKSASILDLIESYYINEIQEGYDPVEEEHFAYVMRDENGQLVLFSILSFCDLISHENPAYFDTLIVHPQKQNMGYATKFLTELFANQERFFGWKPDSFMASFNSENESAKKLFQKFGFEIRDFDGYTNANTRAQKLIQESEPGSKE